MLGASASLFASARLGRILNSRAETWSAEASWEAAAWRTRSQPLDPEAARGGVTFLALLSGSPLLLAVPERLPRPRERVRERRFGVPADADEIPGCLICPPLCNLASRPDPDSCLEAFVRERDGRSQARSESPLTERRSRPSRLTAFRAMDAWSTWRSSPPS